MFDAVILAAGDSMRTKTDKLFLSLGDDTVLSRAIKPFKYNKNLNKIILVVKKENLNSFTEYAKENDFILVSGGKSRTESVKNALDHVSADYVLIHDGARPFITDALIDRVYFQAVKSDSAIPALKASDSIKKTENGHIIESPDRENFYTVQTPQGFKSTKIKDAYSKLKLNEAFTDDSAVFEKYCSAPFIVNGDVFNTKITSPSDILGLSAKVGTGFDVHPLVKNRKLILFGVEIPFEKGLSGHSDADVATHALMDALLSAVSEPDIGAFFPDTDETLKNISSMELLARTLKILEKKNRSILNVAVTVIAEKPRLFSYREQFIASLSEALNISKENIAVGFTSTEGLGIIGEEKAIAASAIVAVV